MENISEEIQKKNSHDEILYKTNIFDNIEKTLQETQKEKNIIPIFKQDDLQKIIYKNIKPDLILSTKQNQNSNYGKTINFFFPYVYITLYL